MRMFVGRYKQRIWRPPGHGQETKSNKVFRLIKDNITEYSERKRLEKEKGPLLKCGQALLAHLGQLNTELGGKELLYLRYHSDLTKLWDGLN